MGWRAHLGPCCPFLQSSAKLCLRNFHLFPECCHFLLKLPEGRTMRKGADVMGASSVHKMGWVVVGDGERRSRGFWKRWVVEAWRKNRKHSCCL